MHLASIHIYPLKAARAVDLEESFVEPCGLADDRRWLLVDEKGRFISQREEPSLARVVVTCGRAASACRQMAERAWSSPSHRRVPR